jgi:enolase
MLVFHTAAKTPFDAVAENIAVHRRVGERLSEMLPDYGGGKGDEGAYAPPLDDETALKAVAASAGGVTALGLDVAANSLYDSGRKVYRYRWMGELERSKHIQYLERLATSYGLKYLEDPVEEGDWDGFRDLRSRLPKVLICGDDLVVTRADLIREAAGSGAINAVILKPNQVGTLSATLEAAAEAESWGVAKVVSHRSGETCDSSLAHIAVGVGANLIKSGIMGGERISKANELLRIWEKADGRLEMSRAVVP